MPQKSRPLRILHLAHARWFNAEVQYAVDLATEMNRLGHRAAFLGQIGSPGVREARAVGLEVFEEAGFNRKGVAAVSALGAALRLRRLLGRRRFEAVVVHRPEALPLVAWACRRARVPVVRVRGDMRPVRRDPFNRRLYHRGLDGVVATNGKIARGLVERLGAGLRLATIHGGVDPDRFEPEGPRADLRADLGFPSDSFLVGILGRLGFVKGHEDFLEAARRVVEPSPGVCFAVLVKKPCQRERDLRALVEGDPRLRGRVGFLGLRSDLPAVLRAFDLGVVASTGSEANCRVGLEWMASGVPLVATRVGVLPDLVDDGITGFLVGPGDASELAEKIVYCAGNRGRAGRMGPAARARVMERFTLEHCARAHLDFLRSLPGTRP